MDNISPHVDMVGNLPSARKCTDGFASKPLGGSWQHPQKNCMNSSKLHSFAVDENIIQICIFLQSIFLFVLECILLNIMSTGCLK